MTIRKFLGLSLLLLLSAPVTAAFNPYPDAESILIGAGVTDSYAKVIYVCDTGSDTNDGSTPNTPYKTFDKAVTGFSSQPAGTIIAFCRGGLFYRTSLQKLFNVNASAENPITFRDYQPTTGSSELPKLVSVGTTASPTIVFNFQDGGAADSDEGYVIKNLEITSLLVGRGEGVFVYNDADHVSIINCKIHHLAGGINIAVGGGGGGDTRYAAETINELVFTSIAGAPDTITRTTGVWGTNIKRGDGIVISGSSRNNKIYRINSRQSDTILTITDGPIWGVTNEVNTVGVTATVLSSDGISSNISIQDSIVSYNKAFGFFGALNYGSISASVFENNGYGHVMLDHNIYLSKSNYPHVNNNVLSHNSLYNGNCSAVSLVIHGSSYNGTIENNTLYQPESQSGDGCWGIVFDNAYSEFEEFTGFVVKNNTLLNMGSVGIGCNACIDILIKGNTITSTKSSSYVFNGVVVPDRPLNVAYGNPVSSNITISNNTIIGKGASALSNTASTGISVGSGTDTGGTITVTGNTVKNVYTCISNTGPGTGATVSVSGNTTSNCTSGN